MKKLLPFIGAILILGFGAQAFGAFNPTGGGTYRLRSSVTSSQTSVTLSSFKEPVSNIPYTMSYLNSSIEYATLEPQSTTKEFISFTGITQNSDGTATLTGVTRGLAFSYPYTASTTLQQAHPAQSILILSNPPQLTNQYVNKNNDETISGTLSGPEPTASGQYATKNYVDTHVNGGTVSVDHVAVAGNAGETVSAGQLVYFERADGRWYKASTALTGATTDSLLGIAQGAGTAGNAISGGVLTHGLDTNQSGLSTGLSYFLGSSAGTLSSATSSQMIGKAKSATSIYVEAGRFTSQFPAYSTSNGSLTITGATTISSTTALNGNVTVASTTSSNIPIILISTSTPTVASSNTASTTAYTYRLVGGTLGTNSTLRIRAVGFDSTCGSTAEGIDLLYGDGSATSTIGSSSALSTFPVQFIGYVSNLNSASSQDIIGESANFFGNTIVRYYSTASFNTAATTYISVRVRCVGGVGIMGVRSVQIEKL